MPNKPARIQEIDIAIPALRLLAAQSTRSLRTSQLREFLEDVFQIKGGDATPIRGSHQALFTQIVRNIVSDRSGGSNIVHRGFANYVPGPRRGTEGTIEITEKGIKLLRTIGFRV